MSGGCISGGTGVSGLYGTTTDDRKRTMNLLALRTTPTARSMLLSWTSGDFRGSVAILEPPQVSWSAGSTGDVETFDGSDRRCFRCAAPCARLVFNGGVLLHAFGDNGGTSSMSSGSKSPNK